MSRVRPDQLRRQLAKAPPSGSYYVHGSQPVLRDEAVAMLLDAALDPAMRDFNLDIISAQQVDPDALEAACATLPMMAERRVVVLRDVEAWKRKTKAKQPAVAYLERPAPETVLVMVQGSDDAPDAELANRCTTIDCGDLAGPALDAWLDARLQKAGVTLAPDAREHLLRATGADLGLLAAETEKLSGLGGAETLTLETVGALVGVRHGETVDDWRDAVLRDDVPAALAALPRVLDQTGVSGVKLVTTLGS
ncbi:MAG: DNA polymerase III subunit delta, partial [Gemmatimonadales bacterium]|nr:DNA polymerase III subunit delta [Gemmatimonadales bacterium]